MGLKLQFCAIFISFFAPCFSMPIASTKIGRFLHVSDIHLDLNYSQFGDPDKNCHKDLNGSAGPNIGEFGNWSFYCDAPMALVRSAIRAMKTAIPNPDFVIWTGDSSPHVPNAIYSTEKTIKMINKMTKTLEKTYPGVALHPILGNHDYYEPSQYPNHSTRVYKEAARIWDKYIGRNQSSFLTGGYYEIPLKPGLHLIGLNSNLYYKSDHEKGLGPDPDGQFLWLEERLHRNLHNGVKVVLLGHVPPGQTSFVDSYNKRMLKILAEYSGVIQLMLFGHLHYDSFSLVRDDVTNKVVNSILLGSSVTPWTGRNPSFRVYEYNQDSWEVLDIIKYSLDLREANLGKKAVWKREYSYREDYGVSPVSAANLANLLERMKTDGKLFSTYYKHKNGRPEQKCLGICRKIEICTIEFLDKDEFGYCVAKGIIGTK